MLVFTSKTIFRRITGNGHSGAHYKLRTLCNEHCCAFQWFICLNSLGREISGMVTLKHVYEIAKIKAQDPPLELTSLNQICIWVIKSARSLGIKVVRELDSEEYAKFLEERRLTVQQQRDELEAAKEAKMLRTA